MQFVCHILASGKARKARREGGARLRASFFCVRAGLGSHRDTKYSIMTENNPMLFHVCTKGLPKSLLFASADDFKMGMKLIPLCLLGKEAPSVYAFCLMDNHVHFILRGTYSGCLAFIRTYKRCLSRKFGSEGRHGIFREGGEVLLKEMTDPLYVAQAIAYVLRNPVKAGLHVTPQGYPWSSARLYFSAGDWSSVGCHRIGSLGSEARKSLTNNYMKLPKEWLVDHNGMILPECYVNVRAVEAMYGRPGQFMYWLNKADDRMLELDSGVAAKSRYTNEELQTNMNEIIVRHFGKSSLKDLGMQARAELASIMKRRFGAGPSRLSRLLGIEKDILSKLI